MKSARKLLDGLDDRLDGLSVGGGHDDALDDKAAVNSDVRKGASDDADATDIVAAGIVLLGGTLNEECVAVRWLASDLSASHCRSGRLAVFFPSCSSANLVLDLVALAGAIC